MKTIKLSQGMLLVIVMSLFVLNACSHHDEPVNVRQRNKPNTEKGRFDNSPFVWDNVYLMNDSKDKIYIGDLSVWVEDVTSIINPPGIYVGAAYPASSLPFRYDREITYPRNPIDLIFDFRLPFIAEVTSETGSVGYKLTLKDAVLSNDYKVHVSVDNYSVSASMTRFNSYKRERNLRLHSCSLRTCSIYNKFHDSSINRTFFASFSSKTASLFRTPPLFLPKEQQGNFFLLMASHQSLLLGRFEQLYIIKY